MGGRPLSYQISFKIAFIITQRRRSFNDCSDIGRAPIKIRLEATESGAATII